MAQIEGKVHHGEGLAVLNTAKPPSTVRKQKTGNTGMQVTDHSYSAQEFTPAYGMVLPTSTDSSNVNQCNLKIPSHVCV